PKDVATYDLKPEMSAFEVTEKLISNIRKGENQVFIINFANCDMVGHTGKLNAAIKAVETVDTCLGEILKVISEKGGIGIITADHGNADQMIRYETGEPHTFHTTHPVPFILFGEKFKSATLQQGGALCDIAPTACQMIGIKQPPEMTGKSLIK
ncbi:MAG: 2,3-bisphosphoglycerate-independent phosphoglycerate mutase, partial [Proteobacteria bacterium]|nr:2,3-bisphosphoglycerate-independent phosphoglycerate mutase [Pseudomonadota bacterium]